MKCSSLSVWTPPSSLRVNIILDAFIDAYNLIRWGGVCQHEPPGLLSVITRICVYDGESVYTTCLYSLLMYLYASPCHRHAYGCLIARHVCYLCHFFLWLCSHCRIQRPPLFPGSYQRESCNLAANLIIQIAEYLMELKLYYLFTPYSVTYIQATSGGPVNILSDTHVKILIHYLS